MEGWAHRWELVGSGAKTALLLIYSVGIGK